MSHFYGTLSGSGKTLSSRCGTVRTGYRAQAASWQGAVDVRLYQNADGIDRARVMLVPWHGAGTTRVLYDGPVSGAPDLPQGRVQEV